jgi:hypothetical protein
VETSRLLDTRFLNLESGGEESGFFEEEAELITLKGV